MHILPYLGIHGIWFLLFPYFGIKTAKKIYSYWPEKYFNIEPIWMLILLLVKYTKANIKHRRWVFCKHKHFFNYLHYSTSSSSWIQLIINFNRTLYLEICYHCFYNILAIHILKVYMLRQYWELNHNTKEELKLKSL